MHVLPSHLDQNGAPKAEGPPTKLGATSEDMLQTTFVTALGTAYDGLGWWPT